MNFNQYLQYGCGLDAPISWTNFDASPTLFLQRLPIVGYFFQKMSKPVFPKQVIYGNIITGLPINNNSCYAIYCSHILEHLSLTDCRMAIRNTYSYLMTGGIFRLVIPDLEKLILDYQGSKTFEACHLFIDSLGMGKKERGNNFVSFIREWMGNSKHLWMWDFKAMKNELETAGFREIRQAKQGDSSDKKFLEVENSERWSNCLGIECIK